MSLGKRLIGASGATSGPGTEEVVDIFEDNSCKALYTFNYDASDLGGNYSLTEYNSSNNVWGAGGKFNTGYRIKDNSNGYLGITSHGFNYPNTAVSFWFYADKAYGEAYSTARTIFTFQNGTSTRKAYIGVSYNSSEGNWYGFINARSGLYGSTSTTVAFSGVIGGSELDNTWVHIVGQTGSDLVESRRNSFYVNGSLWTGMTYSTGSSTSSGGFHSPVPYRFYVGYYYSGNIQYAPAYPIDQLRIFNKKVTAEEASTLYNESVGTVQSTTDVVYFPTSALDTNLETQEVARYLLNDDVTDDLGNYNGTATSITYTNGKYGKSAVFNGSSSKITTGYTDNPSAFSVSGWIKHTSSTFTGKYHYLAAKGYYSNSSNTNYWYIANYSNANPEFRVRLHGTDVSATSSVAMYLNQWYHLVGTCDSAGNLKLYLDGTLVGSASGAPSRSMGQGMNIGTFSSTYFHEGEIDQVRVFDYALGQEAVNSLYNDSDTPVIIDKAPETAFYKLNGNAYDSAGGFDGTAFNITYANGLFGQAAVFNSSSSNINIGGNMVNSLTTLSVSLWVNWVDTTNSTDDYFIALGKSSSGKIFSADITNSTGIVGFYDGSSVKYSTGAVPKNTWTHIAITANATALKIYLDGSLDSTHTISSLNFDSSGNAGFIGSWITGTDYEFDGSIDQVRIFDQAISSNQVSDLYNEASSAFSLNTLQAYYKLDNSAIDEASGFDGTETNVEYRFGRYGQAAIFNGSSSKIVLPNLSLGLNDPSNFSFSCWFKTNSSTQDNQGIIWLNGSNAGARFGVGINSTSQGGDTSVYFGVGTSSFTYINSGTGAFVANKWVHIAAIKSSIAGMSLYVNNVLKATNTGATGAANYTATGGHRIGAYKTTAESSYFNGYIDQIRIFSSALSSSQVSELYNEKPETDTSNFKTVLYEGTGATQYISNVGIDLETGGGLVWLKRRNTSSDHYLVDSVRGNGNDTYKNLSSNTNNTEGTTTSSGIINNAFEANGFIMQGSGARTNANGDDYVAWCWKGGGDAVSNTNGTITSQVSANQDAGFSIVKWAGSGADGTVGHGLTAAPELILAKRTNIAASWLASNGTIMGYLDLDESFTSVRNDQYLSSFTTTTVGVKNNAGINASGDELIMYCWHSVAGYSSIGSYEGNGTTRNVNLGFDPSWIMIKNIDAGSTAWNIVDTRRDTDTTLNLFLQANTNIAEANTTICSLITNGFSVTGTNTFNNSNGHTFLYMAFK